MNHYAILGIDKTATPAEIKKAYKRMAKKHHPDRNGGDSKMMVLVNKAHDTLMDPARREHYDLTGDEKPLTSIDIEARNSILQLFGALMQQGRINIPAAAMRNVTGLVSKWKAERDTEVRKLNGLEVRRNEVTSTEKENLWIVLIDSICAEQRGRIAAIENKIAIGTRASDMLKAYRSGVIEALEPTGFGMSFEGLTVVSRRTRGF